MSFLAFSPLMAYGLLAGVAAVIGLLYLIKPRLPRVEVASTLLWRRALDEARARRHRWRRLLSALLMMAIGWSLTLALSRPELQSLGASHQRIVVILDNSASMSARTRDGSTRWQHALEGARGVIEAAGAGAEVLVMDTGGRTLNAGFHPRGQALQQLARIPLSPEATGRVPPLPVGAKITRADLFTDGVGLDSVPRGVRVHSVFEPADNVAITGFEARPVPGDPTRYEALVQIVNTAPSAKQITLEVVGANGFRLVRQLQAAAATTLNQILDVTHFEHGVLRAEVHSEADAFDLDNVAYCVVSPHRVRRVLLVTSGDGFLEDALRALPGVALSVRTPSGLGALPPFDAYVFDRYAPREAAPAGALLFRPPSAPWLDAKWRTARYPAVTSWDESHPLSSGVRWRDLRLESAQLADPNTSTPLVTAKTAGEGGPGGALLVAGRAVARWVAVGFSVQDSNFTLQPDFPVFLGTALSWLTAGATTTSESIGRIEAPIADAQIRDGSDHPLAATATANGTLFEAPKPGVYVASNGRERLIIVANAIDPRLAQINERHLRPDAADAQFSAAAHPSWPEPWVWLLAVAFVLVGIEWTTFTGRVTV